MYATIKDHEVKYSGLLAEAGYKITDCDNGMAIFSRDDVLKLAVELAAKISDFRVQASSPHTILTVRMACDKMLLILDWIELDEEELIFA